MDAQAIVLLIIPLYDVLMGGQAHEWTKTSTVPTYFFIIKDIGGCQK